MLPILKRSHMRSRYLKKAYADWKEKGEWHYSPSGLTAAYFMHRAREEGQPFTLLYIEHERMPYYVISPKANDMFPHEAKA